MGFTRFLQFFEEGFGHIVAFGIGVHDSAIASHVE
ncbi:uncharacterized protein METZ01_LOCUS212886, partial [marine metagenome]